MKNVLRRPLSFLLAFLLASASITAAASEALGEDLTSATTQLHQATALSTNVFWSTSYSDLRTENLITYTPGTAVTPVVTYGSVLSACSTTSAMAKTLEAEGYRVIAGLNGDFYNTSTGLPIGLVVSGGQLKSTDGGYYAVGFKADGTAVLGKPALKVSADLGYLGTDSSGYQTEVVRTITGVNKARVSTGGIYLYTYDFNSRHTTGNTESGVDVICSVASGSLAIGGTVTLTVDSVVEASSATAIPEGKVVLSANTLSGAYYTDALRNETAGNTITVTVAASDESWNSVQYAVGALYSLVENGAAVSGLADGANPRTAVGQKADGTLIFYTIDGRQSGYSIGATLSQVAARLIELGCVQALCLDGGGSTTLTVTEPDSTAAETVNSPSGGTERAVTNQIFLVASNQASGRLDHFYVSADNSYVLAGSMVNLSASAVDTNYIPMTSSYQLTASAGTVSGSVLTTPASGGEVTVTASGGGKTGTTVVHAIKTPDSITVKNGSSAVSSLTVVPGGTATLTASAIYNHLNLKADASAFTWSVSGNIGTVSADGKFTATTPGTGTLTVSAGGKSATVAVTVSKIALATVQDFEASDLYTVFTNTGNGAAMTRATDSEHIRCGRGSGKLEYTLGSDGTASLGAAGSFSSVYSRLNFWVYGDNSGNTLSIQTTDGSTITTTDAAVLNFTGWKQISVSLPAGTTGLAGVKITGAGTLSINEETGEQTTTYPAASGAIYLDQMVASYGSVVDTAAPIITASITGNVLTAVVSDAVDGLLSAAQISATYDGKVLTDASYTASTGTLTAALPTADGSGHRVSVYAKDASGNIGRASCDISASGTTYHFTDVQDYWGAANVEFLYTSGVTTGYADGTFRPNDTITRQQFAAMLYRYLGIDGTQYESVTLPFADADKISDYARTAVKALYSIGIIGGTEKNGKLYFNPNSSLTRAQAAAMIGRTQEKGFAAGALSFTDAASIPAYAAPYIQTMTAQGVLGGYADGSFKPSASITRGQMAKILYNLL